MKFRALIIAAAVSAGISLAAEHPSFSGTWMLEAAQSTGAPEWSSMTVAQKGHWFRMAQNDKDGRMVRSFEGECQTDGRYHPVQGGQGGSISCKWDGTVLVTEEHGTNDQTERLIRTSMNPGGALVQDVHEAGPKGVKDLHLVWTRQ